MSAQTLGARVSNSRFRGGVRIGGFNATWPFATLEIDDDQIVVRTGRRKIHFDRESIRALNRYQGIFSSGLQIQHYLSSVDRLFIFWTFTPDKVYESVLANGYNLEDEPPVSL